MVDELARAQGASWESWSCGMLIVTVLGLVLAPVFYVVLRPINERFTAKKPKQPVAASGD